MAVYNSAADLTQAVRQGAIGPNARIFHRRSGQWLPITEHPAYRQTQVEAPQEPLPPLRRRHWTFLAGPSGSKDEAGGHAAPQGTAPSKPDTAPGDGAPGRPQRRGWATSLRAAVSRIRFRRTPEPG
jgi:hypothetical protein